jgi:aminoglycoside phosphotransferase (APT) family kinase protein
MRSKPGPVAKLLPSAHAIEREFRVMHALRRQGFPTPEVMLLEEDESVIGRAFFVMEHVDGRILWSPALPDFTPAARTALYDEMNRVIAALHAVDVAAAGLSDYGKAGNYFERQIGRWSKQYRASETERIEAMDRLIEWLPTNIPAGDEVSVVHGDFRLDNLLFGTPAGGPPVTAVDWQTPGHGAPIGDLSYFIGAGLLPDDRRAHERELLEVYAGALAAYGVAVDGTWLWDQYRREAFAGVIMAVVASQIVGSSERSEAMFTAMATRHLQQAIDLGSLELI